MRRPASFLPLFASSSPRHRLGRGVMFALAATLLLVGGASTSAAAEHGPTENIRRFAHSDVLTMATSVRPAAKWRAMAGDDGTPFLVIERFDRPSRSRLPTMQTRIDTFRYGQGSLSFSGQAVAIESLSWRGRALDFEVVTATDRLSCAVKIRGRKAFRARCEPLERDTPVHVPPRPVNWAGAPSVIRACGNAFFSGKQKNACLDATVGFEFDPAAIIARCDAHFFSDASALTCLRTASKSPVDPGARLAACDAAMFSDAHALACFDHAVTARYEPSRAIAACDKALFSDKSTVSCVEAASYAYADVAGTILACDDATYSDRAAIGCIRRGISF